MSERGEQKMSTMMTDEEREAWLAIRKEAGLKIDPETAEVECVYALTLDPYGVYPDLLPNTNKSGGNTLPVLLKRRLGRVWRFARGDPRRTLEEAQPVGNRYRRAGWTRTRPPLVCALTSGREVSGGEFWFHRYARARTPITWKDLPRPPGGNSQRVKGFVDRNGRHRGYTSPNFFLRR